MSHLRLGKKGNVVNFPFHINGLKKCVHTEFCRLSANETYFLTIEFSFPFYKKGFIDKYLKVWRSLYH